MGDNDSEGRIMDTITARELLTGAALIGALIIALGFAGASDVESELIEARHYCDMVTGGYWPDYKGTAADCPAIVTEDSL